jgi:hypothetical protein
MLDVAMKREQILDAIRRTAAGNGGKPPGRARFQQLTGISDYDLGHFWARYGDAVREAGLEPNLLNQPYDETVLLEKYVGLLLKLGHVPTRNELRLERRANDPTFPSANVYERFGSKADLIKRAIEFCKQSDAHATALETLEAVASTSHPEPTTAGQSTSSGYGFVYLVHGHRGEYKIGRTNLVDRRLVELGATAAIEYELVHEIKTDDPVGVEAYWHRRFADKRMRGEWFKLNAADIRAFKRWKRVW